MRHDSGQRSLRETASITDRVAQLRRLNGLRTAIVHKYSSFEEESVLENLADIRATLYAFAERMEQGL